MSDVPVEVNTELSVNCCDCLLLWHLMLYSLLCQWYHGTADSTFTVIQIPDEKFGMAIWKLLEKDIRM